uniref:Transposase n=1 Tax=Candidatus Kentrum sp. FM TaxID=2126340 RepID=A0A450W304_9GAMM|nr:MAG: hypothetical protein BECKFM1743C_GA0114222_100177 [Candidatus Kentron sp. FM]VFJ61221.1 MAG: hypothetical protein BECKFM1743A_GA0114220_102807 [Candidatus Kentron sp. FM]VFK11440.1 MAG: hypothetical protein BECKFM1743B_GA0114221_101827 [Candidatus Kentron sp. FM]
MFKRAHKTATCPCCPYRVWEEGNHPRAITSEAMMRRKIDYIHHNPVARGYGYPGTGAIPVRGIIWGNRS